ncbi:MAG TPA: alpha/beta fold hydrolase [Gemmatimonadaceae bacterium]
MTTIERSSTPPWVDLDAYPFDSRWLKLSSGARIHYVDEGTGPVVLFVHGTPSWSFEWRSQIRALSNHYRCIAPDLVGMGMSDRPATFAYTPEAHAAALAEFVAALALHDVTLVVHDFGGPIGLPLALQYDSRVSRVVILNTFAWGLDDDAGVRRPARMLGGALGRWLYRHLNFSLRVIMPSAFADRRKLTSKIHRQYLAPFSGKDGRGRVLHAFARALLGSSAFFRDIGGRLHQLRRVPVLIVWGTKDPAFGVRFLDRWRVELPDARVEALDVGHWPQEEAPTEVNEALRSFLAAARVAGPSDTDHTPRPVDVSHRP